MYLDTAEGVNTFFKVFQEQSSTVIPFNMNFQQVFYYLLYIQFQLHILKKPETSSPCSSFYALREEVKEILNEYTNDFQNKARCKCHVDRKPIWPCTCHCDSKNALYSRSYRRT